MDPFSSLQTLVVRIIDKKKNIHLGRTFLNIISELYTLLLRRLTTID
jgi:hypothetical protein